MTKTEAGTKNNQKKARKHLSLNKETLRSLQPAELARVAGGMTKYTANSCIPTGNNCG